MREEKNREAREKIFKKLKLDNDDSKSEQK